MDSWYTSLSLEEVCDKISSDSDGCFLEFQPGTKWHYGLSHDVLGRLIEVISGESLEDFLQSEVFEPLQMTDTSFYLEKKEDLDRLVDCYHLGTYVCFLSMFRGVLHVSMRQDRYGYPLAPRGEICFAICDLICPNIFSLCAALRSHVLTYTLSPTPLPLITKNTIHHIHTYHTGPGFELKKCCGDSFDRRLCRDSSKHPRPHDLDHEQEQEEGVNAGIAADVTSLDRDRGSRSRSKSRSSSSNKRGGRSKSRVGESKGGTKPNHDNPKKDKNRNTGSSSHSSGSSSRSSAARLLSGGGGLVSTLDDMSKFAKCLLLGSR